jgi:HPt (histidine-containing phosphotransfer) domain-containing protein
MQAPAFDRDDVWQMFGGDAAVVRELIALVVQDAPACVQTLVGCARASDLAGVARMGHTIKGAVGNVAASALCALAVSIEDRARAGDAASMPALCDALQVATAALVRDLEAWSRDLERAAWIHQVSA